MGIRSNTAVSMGEEGGGSGSLNCRAGADDDDRSASRQDFCGENQAQTCDTDISAFLEGNF